MIQECWSQAAGDCSRAYHFLAIPKPRSLVGTPNGRREKRWRARECEQGEAIRDQVLSVMRATADEVGGLLAGMPAEQRWFAYRLARCAHALSVMLMTSSFELESDEALAWVLEHAHRGICLDQLEISDARLADLFR